LSKLDSSAERPESEQRAADYWASRMSSFERILARLEDAGLPTEPLTVEALSRVDQMHMGGAASTDELIKFASITATDLVLDAGCGIGGTSRWVAAKTGASVIGLDLTPEAVETAIALNTAMGLNDRVQIHHGSITAMPFGDSTFDVVLIQHCAMQVEAKTDLATECRRVLRPGGRLVFHDWFLGADQPVLYPVPWAAGEETSFLEPLEEMEARLSSSGFTVEEFIDQKESGLQWLAQARASAKKKATDDRGPNGSPRDGSSISDTMVPNIRDDHLLLGFLIASAG